MKNHDRVQIFMTNKMSRRDFIQSLMSSAGVTTDVELAAILGVTKQKIGYWKQEERGLDIEILLQKFGPETITYLKNRYGIEQKEVDSIALVYAEVGKMMTDVITLMIDKGLISVNDQFNLPARQQAGPGPTVERVKALNDQGKCSPEI